MKSVRKHLTYANVMSSLAVFMLLGGGAAIAAGGLGKNTVGSKQLKKNAVTAVKVKDGSLLGADFAAGQLPAGPTGPAGAKGATGAAGPAGVVGPNSVTSASVLDDTAPGGGLNTQDINQLDGDADIQDNTITTFDIATNAIDSDEVLDFGLSNEDIGVLFAQVNGDGTIAGASGGVTSSKIGTGTYVIDYGHDVSSCAFVTTQGEAGVGGAGGAITGNTDRSGNVEATFTTTRDAAGALVDTALQQIVVC
jgi:hypothetical protein